ncbi:MAG: signal recognition particle protein [Proteobacteria bacterium]|nr:signal recognition particle protein [Pseudomonadota bacterium]
MFEALSKGFRNAKQRLAGLQELNEQNLEQALRDVRLSLLEADVELGVTKRFLARVKEKAVGEVIATRAQVRGKKVRIGPSEQFIKICQDELEALMATEGPPIEWAKRPATTGIMVVGLQGSGKTTTAAKLARFAEEQGRRVLLVAADLQRPGAVEQLQVLGERIDVPVFTIPDAAPVEVCVQAAPHARKLKRDTIIYDTAGRLAIDEPLMQELAEVRLRARPQNVFLVVDAMIGQDAVKTAAGFHERIELTGIVLTKLDGDARGGAALSVREVTGAPVRFAGVGEDLDRLEEFRPEGIASRILGFGDVVGLMKDFEQVVDQDKAEQDAQRMLKGRFNLEDFLEQITMIQQMGPLQGLLEKIPFFSESVPENFQVDDKELQRIRSIVNSMTRRERADPDLFQAQPTRLKRVAVGCGRDPKDVAELLQRFAFMRKMMNDIGQQAGMLQKIPGMKQMAAAQKLRDVVRTGGFEGNPMMSNLADSLLEAAVVGDGKPGTKAAQARSRSDNRNKKKNLRKLQKKARKRSRR